MKSFLSYLCSGLTLLIAGTVSVCCSAQTPDVADAPDSNAFVGIEKVFPRLRFDRPVFLCGAGDGSGRIFVVEQNGVVRVFDATQKPEDIQTSDVFLDIRDQVGRRGNEEGLFGFAFHPDFADNGILFAHYTSSEEPLTNCLSRFRIDKDDPNRVDPASEEVILRVKQPFGNHNGGMIAFGHDGYLYISLGDGGSAKDPHGNGQKLSTLLGSIIRIDVDRTDEGLKYAIPADNPFVDTPDARPENWAIGLRNVWRFSFDRKTGDLWAGDVGQDKFEEISLIRRGGNYGWNRFEADEIFDETTKLATEKHDPPIAVYGREWGISITGGNVYRGKKFPQLDGSYFYGDYVSGNLWRIKRDEQGKYENQLVRRTGRSIASFGEDDDGEVYLLSFDGSIYRIVPTSEPENTFDDWPELLSDTGLYASVGEQKIAEHLIPYTVNAPFWSDDATKSRYLEMPTGKKLGYQADGTWQVPVGTTIVKNFERRGSQPSMLETRLIKRTENGWQAATYIWDRSRKQARLRPDGQQFEVWSRPKVRGGPARVESWHAPSSSECASCHVEAAGYVLGLTTAQLNLNNEDDGKNQILRWAENDLVDLPDGFDPARAKRFVNPHNPTNNLETRARVWMDVNCAMCHRPAGPGNASIDLRFETALDKTKMINELPVQGDLGIPGARLVAAGEPDKSLMLIRVETLGPGRMPNIGSNLVDEAGAELLREWIKSLK